MSGKQVRLVVAIVLIAGVLSAGLTGKFGAEPVTSPSYKVIDVFYRDRGMAPGVYAVALENGESIYLSQDQQQATRIEAGDMVHFIKARNQFWEWQVVDIVKEAE